MRAFVRPGGLSRRSFNHREGNRKRLLVSTMSR